MRWQPPRSAALTTWAEPPLPLALLRGARGLCPSCGEGRLFRGYLRVVPECAHCHAPLGLARADDAPPYFTILLLGHVLVPLMILVERDWQPSMWLEGAIFLPLAVVLSLLLLRPVKGAMVGLMLRLGMLKTGPDE